MRILGILCTGPDFTGSAFVRQVVQRLRRGERREGQSSLRLAKSRIFHPVLAFYSEIDQTFSMLVWVWPKGTERERWTPDFMRVAIELPGVT